jgi:hypothetical protein
MEHPNFDSGLINFSLKNAPKVLADPSLEIHGAPLRLDFKLNHEIQAREEILNHSAFLIKKKITSEDRVSSDIGVASQIWQRLVNKFEYYFPDENTDPGQDVVYKLRVRLEHAPNPKSRVLLASKKDAYGLPQVDLKLQFGELEGRTIQVIQKYLARWLGMNGIGRMQIDFTQNPPLWQKKVGWQYHHCGGTRMSNSPREGVVDSSCRVHGIGNLYIAGSSVFPTSGHANPTMNIVAISLRLVDELKRVL